MKRLLPPSLFLGCLAINAAAHFTMPVLTVLLFPWNLIGVPVVALGLYLTVAGSQQFSAARTNINTFIDPENLVTSGLFQYSRNPMYLGFTLALIGTSLLFGSLSSVSGCVVFFLTANYWYIPFEEIRCKSVFGDIYGQYQNKVRRWL